MATAYTHPNAQSPNARTQTSAGQPVIAHARFIFPVAPVVGDTVKLTLVPKAARIWNAILRADKLDSNGTPTIAFNLGDSTSATRFFAASAIAQNGGVAELAVGNANKGAQYAADDYLLLTITAAPATFQSGEINAFLEYYL